MIRLTDRAPIYCSSCLNQQPNVRHVDFDAAVDRGGYSDGVAVKVAFDDLFLCENCLREGAEKIGMEYKSVQDEKITSLQVRLDRSEHERRQAQNYADRLEDAFQHRAQPIEIDHRKKPRKTKEPAE